MTNKEDMLAQIFKIIIFIIFGFIILPVWIAYKLIKRWNE